MGYTHYFSTNELTHNQKQWDKFLEDVKRVAAKFNLVKVNSKDFIKDENNLAGTGEIDIRIGSGDGDGNEPTFNTNVINFNGIGPDCHENLLIIRDDSPILKATEEDRIAMFYKDCWERDGRRSSFCKTARKPYDLLATATLTLYKHHFKDKVNLGSDGGSAGFHDGLRLVNDTLGYDISIEDIYGRDEE